MNFFKYLTFSAVFFSAYCFGDTATANFNGLDGDLKARDDLAIYEPDTGNWFLRTVSGGLIAFADNWGWDQTTPAPGDYNGDGVTDLAVFERTTGAWFIKNRVNNSAIAFATIWGDDSTISVPGDYDGDGKADLAVYQVSTGNWFILTVQGKLLSFGENWGGEGLVPVPADYNGDGVTDLAVYQRDTGNWFIKELGTGQLLAFGLNWGGKGTDPIPGDFDGDGRADLAVYERATGNWFIRTLGGKSLLFGDNWGWNETQPVSGDFDGDGTDDLAAYHRATGNWYIRSVQGKAIAFGVNWGIPSASTPTQTYAHRSSAGQTFLCFGDSITFGRGSSANGPLTGYPHLLERKLEIQFGGMYRCLNFGVPGETTGNGRARLESVINAVPYANSLLLMEGTNDALTDSIFSSTDNRLREMLSLASARGLNTYLATLPPVVPSGAARSAQAARIQTFNTFIPSIAQPTGSVVVNMYGALASIPNWPALYNSPNHPNDAGYLVVRDAFLEAIRGRLLRGAR